MFGQIVFRLYRPRPSLSDPPAPRERTGQWHSWVYRNRGQVGPSRFRFLNIEREISQASDWNNPAWEKLWLYHLHYFDDLNSENALTRATWHHELIERWIAENPPAAGNGWEPYPLSLRIVNWIKWSWSGFVLSAVALRSLANQARYLRRRLEYHLFGNHLLANAKALVFAGLFFEGPESEKWLQAGLSILKREFAEQILADGGHFERSPMYHAIVLEDVLDLLALDRIFPAALPPEFLEYWERLANKMFGWLTAMCHPDGGISFFNDAAFGAAPTHAQLRVCADALDFGADSASGTGVLQLEPSGYVRIQRDPLLVILDAAPVGPDYMPGHAHADTLSFELSWNGQRVLTNSGTSTYGAGPQRTRERSTAAHNTVEVDAENSSDVWDAFRVARRARPFGLQIEAAAGVLRASCSHDGYKRLPGSPVHRRTIELRGCALQVSDTISGRGSHRAAGYFHLQPGLRLEEGATGDWLVELARGVRLRIVGQNGLRLKREEGLYSLEFGAPMPRPVLVWRLEGELPLAATVDICEETMTVK